MVSFTVQYSYQDLGSESVDTCNPIENSFEFNVVRQEYRDLHELTLPPGLAMNGGKLWSPQQTIVALTSPKIAVQLIVDYPRLAKLLSPRPC